MTNSTQDQITIRPVQPDDCENGFFDILSQLTVAPKLHRSTFTALVDAQRAANNQLTLVAVNTHSRVLATGSVFIEPKFIRSARPVGHIEDIVVDKDSRGLHLGKRIILHLVDYCKTHNCYKVILDCADENIAFYQKCGFSPKERQMTQYL